MSRTQCRSTKMKHSQTRVLCRVLCCALCCWWLPGLPGLLTPYIPSGPNFILNAVMKCTASAQTSETSRAATQVGEGVRGGGGAPGLLASGLLASILSTLNPDLPEDSTRSRNGAGYVPFGDTYRVYSQHRQQALAGEPRFSSGLAPFRQLVLPFCSVLSYTEALTASRFGQLSPPQTKSRLLPIQFRTPQTSS